ncbi:hypothetical protein QE152_g22699 [Popillia japonica]|uniref:Uncharacterized protein n=1 Tax=Popillia japonica TaxID=7064 RepID=A0AAW1KL15_POPJA
MSEPPEHQKTMRSKTSSHDIRNDTLDCSYPFYSGSKPEAFAFSKQKHITPPRPNSNLIMLSAIPLLDNSLFSTLYDGVSGKTGKWGRWGSLGDRRMAWGGNCRFRHRGDIRWIVRTPRHVFNNIEISPVAP